MVIPEPVPPLSPPIPAPELPPVASSVPVPSMVSLPDVPFFWRPAQFLPLFKVFVLPSARVIVTSPVLLSSILNAQAFSVPETSMFTPARVIFALTPLTTTILSSVVETPSLFAIVTAVSVNIYNVVSSAM